MAGHVRRRGKRWQARYPDPLRVGTHKIERTFRTKDEAEAWLIKEQASVLDGIHIDPRRRERPFADVIAAWRESWADRLSPTTVARYDSAIRTYLEPEFGRRKIGSISNEVVQRYVNSLKNRGDIAPGTVRNVYAVMRTAMSYAVRIGMVQVNPCANIDLPRPRRVEMLFLTADEVARLAEAIQSHFRVLVYTAAYTGLRAGELGGLQRRDVDLLRGVLHVRRALKDVNGHLSLGPTKTHAQRVVSLPRFLREMLAEHLAWSSLGGTAPDSFVFTNRRGGPMRHGLFYGRYFKRAAREALPPEKHGLRFHDLRHTCVALLVQQGVHPKAIQAHLGHSSITVTLDRYGHLFPSVEEALAEALDAAFVSATGSSENVAQLSTVRGEAPPARRQALVGAGAG